MMTNFKKLTYILGLSLLCTTGMTSCESEVYNEHYGEPDDMAFIPEILAEQPNATTTSNALKRTGLDPLMIGSTGYFTVFAPSDQAWETYFSADTTYSSIEEMPDEELEKLLLNHIITPAYLSYELEGLLQDNQTLLIRNFIEKYLSVYVNDSVVYVNANPAQTQDLFAFNGVVHVVDNVLPYRNNIKEIMETKPELTTHLEAIQRYTEIQITLSVNQDSNGNYYEIEKEITPSLSANPADEEKALTMLAVTNDAWAEFFADERTAGYSTVDELPDHALIKILNGHAKKWQAVESPLSIYHTNNSGKLFNKGEESSLQSNEAAIASNGHLYILDELPMIEEFDGKYTLKTFYSHSDLSLFYEMMNKADEQLVLNNDNGLGGYKAYSWQYPVDNKGYTLLAPTNDAMIAAGYSKENIKALPSALAVEFMMKHIIYNNDPTMSEDDLLNGGNINVLRFRDHKVQFESVNGEIVITENNITKDISGEDSVFVELTNGQPAIVESNIMTNDDYYIHKIDQVLFN
ncbi:fasciclin domain-containing protein [Flammeovirga agarivorans]|uniref:Fasciclin domain-containing protein n=1 Tax=Flammeovirga agarivorans TaxID=2726742 RepID=A0A7X8SPK1_9BACT|nr:fasciclin domain-containing protein [Flammeovirga agarivorans]NLR93955.1 fasciclin domain-containing protein [Flammeovirga agarivorans]